MRVFRTLEAVSAEWGGHASQTDARGSRRSIVAIGNFDGVHCGHRAILSEVRERAQALGARSVVVTFDPHPLRVLRPAEAPRLLTPLAQRLDLLAGTGVDATLVLPFTEDFSLQTARSFAVGVLQRGLRASAVHEGDNFRFGYQASAGVPELRVLGEELGFSVVTHPVLYLRGCAVSSSQVRALVAEGRVEQARALLGRPFSIHSTPARGRGIGTRLLVPTVNLATYAELKPAHGVYVTELRVGGQKVDGQKAGERRFQAITNAGNRPTFGEDSYAIESYLLDYTPQTDSEADSQTDSENSSLSGSAASEPLELSESTPLKLSFLHRLRGEQRFPSPDALKQQIELDIAHARRYHALAHRLGSRSRW